MEFSSRQKANMTVILGPAHQFIQIGQPGLPWFNVEPNQNVWILEELRHTLAKVKCKDILTHSLFITLMLKSHNIDTLLLPYITRGTTSADKIFCFSRAFLFTVPPGAHYMGVSDTCPRYNNNRPIKASHAHGAMKKKDTYVEIMHSIHVEHVW